jgi:hypothetical protein
MWQSKETRMFGEGEAKHSLLECSKTQKWMQVFVRFIKEDQTHKKVINCRNALQLKNTEKYLFSVRVGYV